jgi:hypothetical protein
MQIKCSSSGGQILPLVPLHSQSNPILALQLYFFKIHYNIILPSMVRSSKRSPSFRFLRQNPECISLSLIRNICWPSNKIWWTIQITKHLFYSFLQSPPFGQFFLRTLSLNGLSLCSPLNVTDQLSDSNTRTGKYGNTSRHFFIIKPTAYKQGRLAPLVSWLQTIWHTPVPSVQLSNSWRWAEELPETCRGSFLAKINSGN